MQEFFKAFIAFVEVILCITGLRPVENVANYNVETASLSWEYFKANQFLGKYTIFNVVRHKRIEDLYDDLLAHGIDEVSGFQKIPPKEEINFLQRPFNWG